MTHNMLLEADDQQLITITPEWMAEKFNEMNKLCFGGALKPCRFSLFKSGKGSRGGTLGWFKIHKEPGVFFRRMSYGIQAYFRDSWNGDTFIIQEDDFNYYLNPEIQLNGNYLWTEKAALSTLVHEMCHYYVHRDGFWPKQSHGPEFMHVARMASMKSNEFFTVERLASAEQMSQMDFTDDMKDFNNKRAAKGIRYFKMELLAPESARHGVYKFAYAVPAQTIIDKYAAWIKSVGTKRFKRATECVTTDGTIKRYHTVTSVGRWYYSDAKSFEELMADVKPDSETDINFGEEAGLSEPWYIIRMKYVKPYRQGGNYYYWGYWIVEPQNFNIFKNYLMNRKTEFSYADYSETTDAKVLTHKPSNPKSTSINYLSVWEDVMPNVKKSEPTVLFDDTNEEPKVQGTTSLGTFLYGPGNVNPHLAYQQQKQAAEPKRYTFTMKVMSSAGVPSTFTITNATEEEAKQQMKQRFPKWSDQVIDTKFKMYTNQT